MTNFESRIERWTRAFEISAGESGSGDAVRVTDLYNSIYSRRVDARHYAWRYFPAHGRACVLLAQKENMLAGAYGYRINRVASPGGDISAALGTDMMVGEPFRATGLVFARLNLEAERAARADGASLFYLFPNQRGAAAWLASEGWSLVRMLRTFDRSTAIEPYEGDIGFHRIDRFGAWVDPLTDRFRSLYVALALVRRDAEYLNWRFVDNPTYDYDMFDVRVDGESAGYLVLKIFRDAVSGNAFGDIVDLIWTRDDPALLEAMLRYALGHFAAQSVRSASIWLETNTLLDSVGSALGFRAGGMERAFCCRAFDKQGERLLEPEGWYLTLSDSEIY